MSDDDKGDVDSLSEEDEFFSMVGTGKSDHNDEFFDKLSWCEKNYVTKDGEFIALGGGSVCENMYFTMKDDESDENGESDIYGVIWCDECDLSYYVKIIFPKERTNIESTGDKELDEFLELVGKG